MKGHFCFLTFWKKKDLLTWTFLQISPGNCWLNETLSRRLLKFFSWWYSNIRLLDGPRTKISQLSLRYRSMDEHLPSRQEDLDIITQVHKLQRYSKIYSWKIFWPYWFWVKYQTVLYTYLLVISEPRVYSTGRWLHNCVCSVSILA